MYAETQVRNGIAFLDTHVPNWREHVNWSILDMRNEELCVLGQVYGEYEEGVARLSLDSGTVSALGFYRCDGFWYRVPAHEMEGLGQDADPAESWADRYELLTQTWKQIMDPVPA